MTQKPILILALPKHDDAFTSTSYQLAKEFARERMVWYISHPYTWIDFLKNIRKKKAWKRFWASWNIKLVTEDTAQEQLTVLYLPLVLPINGLPPGLLYDVLSTLNHRWIAATLQKLIRRQRIDEYIFINSHDFYLGRIYRWLPSPFLYIYHCIDPIIKAYSARHGVYLEKEAATQADLVITTSPFLQRKMQQYHPKSYCVPNAANFALSHRATLPETEMHPEVRKIAGPRVGYIGNIERRINYTWLTEIFTRRANWQLVMIGPRSDQYIPESFLQLSNVHFIPPVPHHQLPNVLKAFDVAFIPFQKDEVSAQIYPLKLFEYMGSGKPVVTTDFNHEVIEPFQEDIYVGATAVELEDAIEKALTEKEETRSRRRIQIASQNDWAARGQQFSELINEHSYVKAH
uniref:Glycosyltransferase n=1 Tax=Roseihalotalea indica TaxID=2867963 RepID=A0AA49JBC5_9BACT|nr:glycosyltransferase [Tunicatimonas sp. TK19036]